ncbi:ABC transporter permease [soil metagenome]
MVVAGAVLIGAFVVMAIVAPWVAPHDPRAITGDVLEQPSDDHLFGTNESGQDIFSQILHGARPSLIIAVEAATLVVIIGGFLGVASGLLGGLVDMLIMRAVDVMLALPGLPLILLIVALAGPGRTAVVGVIALFGWPRLARVVRSQALSLRQRGFIAAARGFGGGRLYVLRRHLLPAVAPLLVTGFIYVAEIAILIEAGLAFLGLGDPTQVTWGSVLNRALNYPALYFTNLWTRWVLPAGMAITLAVLGFTFLGVGLEPRFNPAGRDRE